MNVDCAGCIGHPHACGDCSIGLLLGPVVSVTSGDDQGNGRDSEMSAAIAVFAASGMLPGLRSVSSRGDVRAGGGVDTGGGTGARQAG